MDKFSSETKFSAVCATQLGGPFGLRIWGVVDGHLFSTRQKSPNAPWEEWSQCSEAPQNLYALTAAQAGNGQVSLWALGPPNGVPQCTSQTSVGADSWAWADPRVGWQPIPNGAAPFPFVTLCACDASDKAGRQLWGIGRDGCLYTTYERERLGGNWCPWVPWDAQPLVDRGELLRALTAARNGNGEVSLWALDSAGVLHCRSQIQGGAAWDPWGKGWSPVPRAGGGTPVKFIGGMGDRVICACRQGGSLGRALWVLAGDGQLYWTYETAAMGGGWTDWQKFPSLGDSVSYSLTAARQKDGRVALWARVGAPHAPSTDLPLHNTIQRVAGSGWREWEAGGTLWEDLAIFDEIERTLARKPGNEGVTYLRTSGNKFTLLDTPRLWGQPPTATAKDSDACAKLLQAIADVIGSAERTLDITLLYNIDPLQDSFPDGGFQDAISRGFKTLADNRRKTGIRILLGAPFGFGRSPKNAPAPKAALYQSRLQRWLIDTIRLRQRDVATMTCPVQIALNYPGTWNHSKIIAADDKQVVTGGHNFWAGDYLGRAPVHDVSGLFVGPAARAARQFCDKLWLNTVESYTLIGGKIGPGPPPQRPANEPSSAVGDVEVLSLGRLGQGLTGFSIGSNASVTARIVALCKAKSCIRISQQSLLGLTARGKPYDFYTCLAIVRAVRAGVNVQIVLSNELPNYGGSAAKVLTHLEWLYLFDVGPDAPRPGQRSIPDQCKKAPMRDHIDEWADLAASSASAGVALGGLRPSVSKYPALADFRSKFKLATLYYSDNQNRWKIFSSRSTKIPSTWRDAGNHSKIYIIDDECFYVGSDNFYVSDHQEGLQEFGYLIEGKKETQKFIEAYWDNLWKYSGPRAFI
jgi:phosphatidylserine/phosphatidylglycerophosphate/cardiolipin synthase-like enzyme